MHEEQANPHVREELGKESLAGHEIPKTVRIQTSPRRELNGKEKPAEAGLS